MRQGLIMVCDVDLGAADATRTHTVEVARGFAELGLRVDLIARGADPGLHGVDYHDAGKVRSTFARLVAVNATGLRTLVGRRRGAGRFYVRHEWALVPLIVAARLLGYRVVAQVDDIQFGREYEERIAVGADWVRRFAALVLGRLAHGIVAVTPGIKNILVREYRADPRRVLVLPNGVDIVLFEPQNRREAIERLGLDPDRRYVVFTGLFASWVEFDTMLRAFAHVTASRPDASLVLVGDGPRRSEVERLVHELGLEEHVTLMGFVRERELVRDVIGAATVCLVAHWAPRLQRIGASPTKVAEYLASGRAVVALAIPGVREMVEEGGSGLAVPNEPLAMAEAIVFFLNDPEAADRAGAAGRQLAEERYSWLSVVRRTLPLFDQPPRASR